MVEYFNRILDLVTWLVSPGLQVSEVEKKWAQLRGSPPDFDVGAEAIMYGKYLYHDVVSMVIFRETCFEDMTEKQVKAFVANRY